MGKTTDVLSYPHVPSRRCRFRKNVLQHHSSTCNSVRASHMHSYHWSVTVTPCKPSSLLFLLPSGEIWCNDCRTRQHRLPPCLPLPSARFEVIRYSSFPSRSLRRAPPHFTSSRRRRRRFAFLTPLLIRLTHAADNLHSETAETLGKATHSPDHSAVSCFHYTNSQGEGTAMAALLYSQHFLSHRAQ